MTCSDGRSNLSRAKTGGCEADVSLPSLAASCLAALVCNDRFTAGRTVCRCHCQKQEARSNSSSPSSWYMYDTLVNILCTARRRTLYFRTLCSVLLTLRRRYRRRSSRGPTPLRTARTN